MRNSDVVVAAINYAPERTGIAPYTSSLSRGLADRGYSVMALVPPPHYPEWRIHDGWDKWRSSTVEEGVQVTRLKHLVPTRRSTLLRLASELSFGLRLVFTSTPARTLILVSPALFASILVLLKNRVTRRRPTVAWIQDLYGAGLSESRASAGFLAKAVSRAERWFLRSVDHVVVIHDRFAELVHDAGVPASRITVIRNWSHVAASGHTDFAERARTREALGWAPDETVVLHAGNQGVKQGLSNVVDAARQADDMEVPVRFVLLGDGNTRKDLENLGAGIRSLQFIDPMPDDAFQQALDAADVLLVNELPNLREMCVPSKLTTYFATGRPVLAATDPLSLTAREIAASSAGVCVPAAAPAQLLDAAIALRRDESLSEALGAAGLAYRSSVLSMPAAIDAWETVLAAVTSDSHAQHLRVSPSHGEDRPAAK